MAQTNEYVAYGDEAPNLFGALLFLGYIVAALVLSLQAVSRIYRQYHAIPRAPRDRRRIRVMSILALASFSTLSYNMLAFLVFSYRSYLKRHGYIASLSPRNLHLWEWMHHSGLFEDFAHALVARPDGWWWTQLALLASFQITLWMARCFRQRRTDGLGVLFLISQILPISYTLNLAYLTFLTQPPRKPAVTANGLRRVGQRTDSKPDIISLTQLVSATLFLASLYAASGSQQESTFLPLVGVLRLLLFSPYLLQDGTTSTKTVASLLAVLGAAMQVQQSGKVQARSSLGQMASALLGVVLHGHSAVRALGQDVVLAGTSSLVYVWLL